MSTEGLKSASDTSKQFISLSTGLIALTVTFADKFSAKNDGLLVIPELLKMAWGSYALVILTGAWTLMAITGSLNTIGDGENENTDANAKNITIPAGLMVVSFVAAIVLTVLSSMTIVRTV